MPMRLCPLTIGEEPPIRRLAAFRKAPCHLAQRARVIIAMLGAANPYLTCYVARLNRPALRN